MPRFRHAIVLALAAAAFCACSSSSSEPAPAPTSSVPPATVALVFETGSGAGHTADILAVLQREPVRATFSVTGIWAEQQRDLLLAISAAGHQFINGGYHGASFTGASTGTPPLAPNERSLELSRTEVTVYHLTGRSTRPYWRPAFGDLDEGARRDAAAADYTTIALPTIDTAASPSDATDTIVDRLVAAATDGAILALHTDSQRDAAALPNLIAALRAKGHTPGALEDLPP